MNVNDFKDEVTKCAQANGCRFYYWGNHLPNGMTCNHQQIDSDTYGVQIYVSDREGFSVFEKIRDEMTVIFEKHGLYYENDNPIGDTKRGWFREIHYTQDISKAKKNQGNHSKAEFTQTIETQITGNLTINSENTVIGDKNKVEQSSAIKPAQDKGWLKKELVKWVLGIISALIIAYVIYYLGWR